MDVLRCVSSHHIVFVVVSVRQEAIEKSSFFEPRRVIERGNVTEAFKTVDQLYEGKSLFLLVEHAYAVIHLKRQFTPNHKYKTPRKIHTLNSSVCFQKS